MAAPALTAASDANTGPLKDDPVKTKMRCPDPSAHKAKDSSLQDHASAAALHSTRANTREPLASDGKVSSAGAAASLKHARAQDLPSYPIVGIDAQSSAGTAASIAHANHKSPEGWKPEQSTAAGRAALLAHEYKSAPMWKPEASAAGSRAALLAHKDSTKVNLWTPEASTEGNSAANIAMRKKTPDPKYKPTQNKLNGALIAATGAVSNSGRKRSQSTPAAPLYPDSKNSARNALNAATLAHGPSMKANSSSPATVADSNRLGSGAMEAARIQHSKSISRNMYTSTPPVAMEVDEKRHNEALRASAISMAKKMYDAQQSHAEQVRASKSQAQSGAVMAHGQQPQQGSDVDIKQQALRYLGVQEAAQKLAAERLAKISPDENAAFRSYYGYEKPRSKLAVRRGRNRASSNPEPAIDSSDEDDFQSRRIRSQMSQLSKTLAEVDAKKQEQDRRNLIAAAERKVHAQMLGMDKKIFDETGKMSPSMIEEWDAKARARASANSEARMEHHGQIHLGQGKYVSQADVEAIAQARIQPTLDEIAEKTEKRRAEEEERRLELEEKKRQAQIEKERAAELKAEEKRARDEERRVAKSRTAEEKTAAKQEREAEKEKKSEEKRMQKEERRKSKAAGILAATAGAGAAVGAATPANITPANVASQARSSTEEQDDNVHQDSTLASTTHASEPESSHPASPTSPKSDSKVKSFLNKFKRRSHHAASSAENDKPSFIGGAALRESSSHSRRDSVPEAIERAHSSQRRYSDVSSISTGQESVKGRGRGPERTFSGLSAVSGNTEFEEARDEFDEKLAPPANYLTETEGTSRHSSYRDSKFHEIGI